MAQKPSWRQFFVASLLWAACEAFAQEHGVRATIAGLQGSWILYCVLALLVFAALFAGGYYATWRLTTRRCRSCHRRFKAWFAACPRCGFQSTEYLSRRSIQRALEASASPSDTTASIRHAFLVLDQGGKSVHYPLKLLDNTSIGRSEQNDIVIADAGISGRHCRVEHRQNGFRAFDLGSTNGTFINGARIEKASMEHGDRIRLGHTTLVFMVEKSGTPFGRM
jgi:hypothetical protein